MDKKAFLGLMFCLGAVILIIISVSMPWYQFRAEGSGSIDLGSIRIESDVDAHFDRLKTETVTTVEMGDSSTQNRDTDIDDYEELPAVKGVLNNTRVILVLGLLILIMGILGVIMKMAEKMDKNIVGIILVVGCVLILLAPIYLMVELPSAIGEDLEELDDVAIDKMSREFSGSDERRREFLGVVTEVKTRWGGGPGWYLAFFAAGLAVMGAVALFLSEPRRYSAPISNSEPLPRRRVKRPAIQPEQTKGPHDGPKTIIDEDEGMINY